MTTKPETQLARSLHSVQRAGLHALAARLNPSASHLAPREMMPEECGGAYWFPCKAGADYPPGPRRGATLWPLPARPEGYGPREAQTCQREGVVLLVHPASRQHALASYDAHEEPLRIGRAYCMLDLLPPYELVSRLVQETPPEPNPSAPWTDVLLLAACLRSAQHAEAHAQLLQRGLRERQARLEEPQGPPEPGPNVPA